QLVGRPVPDVCRHLGLTSGTLSSASSAAAPVASGVGRSAGTASGGGGGDCGARTVAARERAVRPSENTASSKKGNGAQGPASRSAPLGRASSSTSPAQATPTSSIAAGKHGASAGAGGAIPARKDPPAPAAAGGEQAGPPPAASHQGSTGNRAMNGKTSSSPVEAPATISRVAHDLVRDAFACSLDCEGLVRQHQPLGDAAHGKGRPGVLQRAGSGVMPKAMGAPGKVALGGRGSRRRLPKRLRRAVPLFEEIIGRAHRCKIGRLLETHCPLPQSVRGTKAGKRGTGEGEQALGPNKREGGLQAAVPPPSPSDVSTLHGEVGEQAEDISAADLWRQEVTAGGDEDVGSEGGGRDHNSSNSSGSSSSSRSVDSDDENKEPEESSEEEDMMDTGSTVKEVRMGDNGSFTVRTHGGVGGISCADTMQGQEEEGIGSVISRDRASAERAAEPQRLFRGGCADASPWESASRGTHESGGGTSGSSSGGDDSGNTSDATLLDEAPTVNG
ncbi:unnamed protein product, partial [Ectocarpus sp. 13 AM-2016]